MRERKGRGGEKDEVEDDVVEDGQEGEAVGQGLPRG
jgi:hypothetical protein